MATQAEHLQIPVNFRVNCIYRAEIPLVFSYIMINLVVLTSIWLDRKNLCSLLQLISSGSNLN